jgi:uncharacterized delta-60 repeat protein
LEQPDSRIVGAAGNGLLRLLPGGTFDPSFDGGVALGPIVHRAVVQQADGRLVGAGSAPPSPTSLDQFALARYHTNGSLDVNFGNGGRAVTEIGAISWVTALRLQPDTKLVAAGQSDSDFALARYFSQDCGNRLVDPGEQCDDGNTADGDCCSASCQIEPDGASCTDGAYCNGAETCRAGSCQGGTMPCPVSCDENANACIPDCPAAPLLNCRRAETSTLLIMNGANDDRDKLAWRWSRGASTAASEFADPTSTTEYALCLYDGSSTGLGSARIPSGASWTSQPSGYRYRESAGDGDGVRSVLLKASAVDRTKILVKGRGLALPDLPLSGVTEPLTIQIVHGDTGRCWESRFDRALTNGEGNYRASSP